MHRRYGYYGRGGCGPGWGGFGRSLKREDLLRWLEEYQRDLEERTADVADLIRRLREDDEQPTETASV